MSDESVYEALRSTARLVVIESPAGCGKTFQGACYASDAAQNGDERTRVLVLTHTHAACSVFADRTKSVRTRVEIRTLDSLINGIGTAYQKGIGLPDENIFKWLRAQKNGHDQLAERVSQLLELHPFIASDLSKRYPLVICDEHQDASSSQHSIVKALKDQGTKLRVFADPLQTIFEDAKSSRMDWNELVASADVKEGLDFPHRWSRGCSELGNWTLKARESLKSGGLISLRKGLPKTGSIKILRADNLDSRLSEELRAQIYSFERRAKSLLILTKIPNIAKSLVPFFNQRLPLWEGHVRKALDVLVKKLESSDGDCRLLSDHIVQFMCSVGTGFTKSGLGNRFHKVASGNTRIKSDAMKELALILAKNPDYQGVSEVLKKVFSYKTTHPDFKNIRIVNQKEFWEAVRLGTFETLDEGVELITARRQHAMLKPAPKSITTVYKAKGLECESVIVTPCDDKSFPDDPIGRCLLYVALSRATKSLLLVVPSTNPSPLLVV